MAFNRFYRKIGLFGKSTVALDSVKVKANNSKKRNHNKITVERTLKKTEERIDEYISALDEADKIDGYNEEGDLTTEQIHGILDKLNAKKEKNLRGLSRSLKKQEKRRFPRPTPIRAA